MNFLAILASLAVLAQRQAQNRGPIRKMNILPWPGAREAGIVMDG